MAAVDVIVDNLVTLWRIPAARHYFPWIFVLISVVGSVVKELELVPPTYFSSSRNVLNMSASFLGRRLLSLAVATAVWYVCTETFFYIEDLTGSCFETGTVDVLSEQFTSKSACRHAGLRWQGYDISGHSFILSYSALFIVEETAPMSSMKTAGLSALPRTVLNLLYVALNLIVILWVWMFACTSVYFHDLVQKWLGTTCGLLGWYLTYRVWYLMPLSPGLPPQRHLKEKKQHA
ncbi:putative fat storage-inducing transmembrane protein 2 [Scophthalmus maximus]|uniref:Putative fat storage-inducing transmembrane protein 2 n=1 Tax=Scophthalmus maximus TaxID=52904 RepID=A0A2U9C367_SCOMX|nr:putative fat storage-inducing transmembrane protein 2 [Scophthalmus maximus]